FHRLAPRHRGTAQPGTQGLAFEQLRYRVGTSPIATEVMNRQNIGMRKRSHRPSLTFEARQRLRIVGETFGQYLDGHLTVQPGIARPVNFAHSARAERRQDFVRAEPSADGKSHRYLPCAATRRRTSS